MLVWGETRGVLLSRAGEASTLSAAGFCFSDPRILLGQDGPQSIMETRQMVRSTQLAGVPFLGLA